MAADPPTVRVLAGHAAAVAFDDLPADVVALAGMAVLDTVGVAVAGRHEDVVTLVRDELAAPGDTVLWGGGRADAQSAALVNGTAAHALDFDDYAPGSGLHPSAPLVASLWSAAALRSARGRNVTGRDLVAAYVAGYEAQERLGLVLWPSHYARGFHTTGTAGTVGAAVGAAHLLGADADRIAAAAGLAATDAAGVKAMFGTMGKPYHAGRAAAAGLRAARLALRGMTVGTDPLFGEQGFVAAASDAVDPAAALTPFGAPWHVRDLLPKLHPSCFGTHAAIGCALDLRPRLDPHAIRDVTLTVAPVLLDVCAIPAPATGLEGKFSLAHTTAVALLDGRVTVASFTDDAVRARPAADLAARVRLELDDRLPKTATAVRIVLDDGRVLTAERDAADRPWTDDPEEIRPRVEEKFLSHNGFPDPRTVLTVLGALPAVDDLRVVADLFDTTPCPTAPMPR